MIKNGTKKEAAMMLSTVIILSFYLKRLQKKKNMEHVRCQGSLPTPFHPAFQVKDTVLQCSL